MGLYSEDKSKQKRSSQDHTDDAAESTSYACFKVTVSVYKITCTYIHCTV